MNNKSSGARLLLCVGITLSVVILGALQAKAAATVLFLRADTSTCFNNGSTSRTLSTSEGSTSSSDTFNLGTSGSVSYDFYSAPLTATGPVITTADKAKVKINLVNTTGAKWQVDLTCVFSDYDPSTGSQSVVCSASAASLAVNAGQTASVSTGTDGFTPGTPGIPAGHLLKLTITLARNSGAVAGQLLYGLGAGSDVECPKGSSLVWPFGSFTPVTTISLQPADRTICVGMGTTFSVQAAGSGGFTYQWRKNGTYLTNCAAISGATSPLLSFNCAASTDAANNAEGYDCVVSSACGAPTVSTRAALTVNAAPGPLAIAGTPGSAVNLSFTGTPGVQYRIQATTNLVAPVWVTISTNSADPAGWVNFTDSLATLYPVRFYRAAFP